MSISCRKKGLWVCHEKSSQILSKRFSVCQSWENISLTICPPVPGHKTVRPIVYLYERERRTVTALPITGGNNIQNMSQYQRIITVYRLKIHTVLTDQYRND